MSIDFYSRLKPSEEAPEQAEEAGTDFYAREPKHKKIKKPTRMNVQLGIGLAEQALAPYEFAVAPLASKDAQHAEYRKEAFGDIERLAEQKASGDWTPQDEELFQHLQEQVKSPEKAEQFVQKADIGVGGLAEKAAEQFGYDIKPEDTSEHLARIAGNIVNPKNLLKAPAVIKSWVNKEARQVLKTQKQWKNLERASAGNAENETLLKFAREKGLTPEETNLLFHSKGRAKTLSKVSKKTKKLKGAVAGLKKKLGDEYNELKELGRNGGHLDFQESEKVIDGLSDIVRDIGRTYVEGPDTKNARIVIEESIERLNNKIGTVEELINSRQGLKESINWNKLDRGDVLKKRADDVFVNAIKEKNPYVYERLLDTDRAYSKYKEFETVLKKNTAPLKFKGIELPVEYGAEVVGLGLAYFFGGLKGIAIKEGIQRLSTQIAINPAFQKPFQKLQKAILSGSKVNQKKAFLTIKHILKDEDPELYEEVKDLEM